MPMITIEDIILHKEKRGSKVCFKCEYPKHGVTWLGFGATDGEAVKNLVRTITNYFTPYESK